MNNKRKHRLKRRDLTLLSLLLNYSGLPHGNHQLMALRALKEFEEQEEEKEKNR